MHNYLLFFFLLAGLIPQSLIAEDDSSGKIDYSLGSGLKRNELGVYSTGSTLSDSTAEYFNSAFKPGLRSQLTFGSLDNESLGGGLKLHFANSPKSDVVDCSQNNVEPISPQVTALAPLAMSIACGQVKVEDADLYSKENCEILESCSKAKLRGDETTYTNFFTTPKLAAEDYAGIMMEDHLDEMQRLDALRKYSEKKYGKQSVSSCRPQFDFVDNSESKECDKSIVEIGFTNLHDSCSMATKTCYDLGKDYGKNTGDKESALQQFFTQRIDAKVTSSLTSDNEFLESISSLVLSKTKPEVKLQVVFAKLKELNEAGKLDPAFGFNNDGLYGKDIKKSPHYDFFKKLVSKTLTPATAKSAIEKHRRDYINEVFSKNCKSSLSYMDICKKATDVGNGNSAIYPQRAKAASRFKNVDARHIDLLKIIYPKRSLTDEEARVLLNAQRCIALGVNKPRNTFGDYVEQGFGGGQPSISGFNSGLATGLTIGSGNISDYYRANNPWALSFGNSNFKYLSPDSSEVKKATNEGLKIDLDDKSKFPNPAGAFGAAKPADTTASTVSSDKSLSDSFSDTFKSVGSSMNTAPVINNQNYNHPNTTFNNYTSTPDSAVNTAENAIAKKTTGDVAAGSGLNERISELTKKLSATEDHLAKLKEERAEADEQKAIQKKKEEDNQQIADLKKQITDLKTAPAKSIEADKKVVVGEDDSSAKSVSTLRAPASEGKAESENASAGHAAAEAQAAARSASTATSSAGEGASSQHGSAAIASSGGAGSFGAKTTLTLTKVEGMSAEKFSESINDKIIELGGQSFEIEENGIKMEIVPEVRDGKVLLDAKGKPRFVKKVKNAKEHSKVRVPASMTDKADLQRNEEELLKRERAEYLKLKNITNKAIQNN